MRKKEIEEILLFVGTKRWSVIFCKEQFWVWHLILYWLWSKNVLGVGFESIGRWLFEKNWFLNAILRLQIFPMTREADVEMLKKQRFCINGLWTAKIHEFERSQNHFVPNVLSVKSCEYNLYMICLSDPPLCAIFLSKRNFLKKSKCFLIFR